MNQMVNPLEARSATWISGDAEAAVRLGAAQQPRDGGATFSESEERQRLCAAAAAHDLRNPLSAAANAARALHNSRTSDEERAFWTECIVRNLTSMEFLVEDFYDVVCRHGEVKLRREILDLTELAQEVVTDCRAIMPSHLLSCEGASGRIHGDRERLRRLLFNLISNAVKYSDAGTRVRVEVWPRETHVCLCVHDQGRGIPPAETERIFLPFTRLEPSGDTAGEGLGLASVKRIADAHGATVLVQGAPGRGTTFEVCFPATIEPRLPEAPKEAL